MTPNTGVSSAHYPLGTAVQIRRCPLHRRLRGRVIGLKFNESNPSAPVVHIIRTERRTRTGMWAHCSQAYRDLDRVTAARWADPVTRSAA